MADDDGFDTLEHATVQQLRHHAIESIRPLCDLFEHQHMPRELRLQRGAAHGCQHAQIGRKQRAFDVNDGVATAHIRAAQHRQRRQRQTWSAPDNVDEVGDAVIGFEGHRRRQRAVDAALEPSFVVKAGEQGRDVGEADEQGQALGQGYGGSDAGKTIAAAGQPNDVDVAVQGLLQHACAGEVVAVQVGVAPLQGVAVVDVEATISQALDAGLELFGVKGA